MKSLLKLQFLLGFIVFVSQASAETKTIQQSEKVSAEKHNDSQDLIENSDPFEGWNRQVFAFNTIIDEYILEPVSIGYDAITPKVIRLLIRNELDYIQSPVTIVNSALQGDSDVTLHTIGRFFVNTTFGGLGLLDAASNFGLEPHQEDFGQTLAVWGVPSGGYYVAPILGSLTLRDLGGKITDFAFSPTTYAGGDVIYVSSSATGFRIVDFRASYAEAINNLKASSSDYYTTVKTIYMQQRNADIKNATFVSEDKREPEFINFDE